MNKKRMLTIIKQ